MSHGDAETNRKQFDQAMGLTEEMRGTSSKWSAPWRRPGNRTED